jgi:hypothetical protein
MSLTFTEWEKVAQFAKCLPFGESVGALQLKVYYHLTSCLDMSHHVIQVIDIWQLPFLDFYILVIETPKLWLA